MVGKLTYIPCAWRACDNQFLLEKKHGIVQKYCSKRCKAVAAVTRRRAKVKKMAIEYKGGKCTKCGYNKCARALEFHHLDPSQKDYTPRGYTISWARLKSELDKCILVCANCHREIHDDLLGEVSEA